MPEVYVRALLEVAPVDEEALSAHAADDCLGLREIARGRSGVLYEAWFAAAVGDVRSAIARWPGRLRELTEVAEADWMAGARAHAQPLDVGERFVLDPREPDAHSPPERRGRRHWLRLPARRAFGTGTHETTQLMVRALEQVELRGARVLDVGSGTGVLSFVALRLGAASCVGFDVDLASAFVGRENCELNGFEPLGPPSFWAGDVEALSPRARFDLVLVNVLPERIAGAEERLAAAVADGGGLLLAGFLGSQRQRVLPRWTRRGLALGGVSLRQEEWELVQLRREGER